MRPLVRPRRVSLPREVPPKERVPLRVMPPKVQMMLAMPA